VAFTSEHNEGNLSPGAPIFYRQIGDGIEIDILAESIGCCSVTGQAAGCRRGPDYVGRLTQTLTWYFADAPWQ